MSQPASTDTRVAARLSTLEVKVEQLERILSCRRCSLPPPPPERWGGDRRSEDHRPPHTCGLPRLSP